MSVFCKCQQEPLEQDVLNLIATATEMILNWLSKLASLIQEHKATEAYKEHARKFGTEKNKSGLTKEERSVKEEQKRANKQKYGVKPLTASGSGTWQ